MKRRRSLKRIEKDQVHLVQIKELKKDHIQSKTDDWLDALEMAINNRFPNDIKDTLKERLLLISDNGCQPTSGRFRVNCSLAGIKQIFTTWSNPKGNADTERVIRRIKEDFIWINDYNTDYPHQALMFETPTGFFRNWINKEQDLHKKFLA